MKWIIGILAVMLIAHLWFKWGERRLRRESEPEEPPADGDPAPPR